MANATLSDFLYIFRSHDFPHRHHHNDDAHPQTRLPANTNTQTGNNHPPATNKKKTPWFSPHRQLPGQLAATVWRSRFGRPAKLKPALGDVDPTGSYCAVPEDWLQKKFGRKADCYFVWFRISFYVSLAFVWFLGWVLIPGKLTPHGSTVLGAYSRVLTSRLIP